jgi:hypothetical protein
MPKKITKKLTQSEAQAKAVELVEQAKDLVFDAYIICKEYDIQCGKHPMSVCCDIDELINTIGEGEIPD